MVAMSVRNLSPATHRAIKARAKRNGRSVEAEVRAILDAAVRAPGDVGLGQRLVAIGREAGGDGIVIDRDRGSREPLDLA